MKTAKLMKVKDVFKPPTKEELRDGEKEQLRIVSAWIEEIDNNAIIFSPKEYLHKNVISIEHVLRQPSLYYPGSGCDFGPFDLFARHSAISTVIYCDYDIGVARKIMGDDIFKRLAGYRVVRRMRIEPSLLGCAAWDDFWSKEVPESDRRYMARSCGFLLEILCGPGKKMHFIYLCTDAVQTYKVLFSNGRPAPAVVVIQDHGLGGQWTEFGGNSKLYRIAKCALPNYLYVHGGDKKAWPGYQCVSATGEPEGMHGDRRALYVRRCVI